MKRPCQPTAREYGIYSRYFSFAKRSSHISSSHAATLRGKNLTIIQPSCLWDRVLRFHLLYVMGVRVPLGGIVMR